MIWIFESAGLGSVVRAMYAERRECASKCDHVAAGVQGMLPTRQGQVVIAFVLHARQHLQCSYMGLS